jgi:hypothetical protein
LGVAVSVVNPAAAAVNPQLPGTLQALLQNGEWGNAFIGLVQDIRTPIPITVASIDSIFAWEKIAKNNAACRTSYAQAIADLLQLPSGISLFRNIIIAHHCLPNLPIVKFSSEPCGSYCSVYTYGDKNSHRINLQWSNGTHVGTEYILTARNTALAAPGAGGNPNSQLDFVTVRVPPSLALAHELGHCLDDLIACKDIMDGRPEFVSSVIVGSRTNDQANYDIDMQSVGSSIVSSYLQTEYFRISRQIFIPAVPPTSAESRFEDLWDKSHYWELINILPSAKILGSGGSNYSDGAIIGEVVRDATCTIHGQLLFHGAGANITATLVGNANGANPVSAEAFVRLGHVSPRMFWQVFNRLNPAVPVVGGLSEQDQFKNLVATMLGLITVPNSAGGAPIPLSIANNNLPSF